MCVTDNSNNIYEQSLHKISIDSIKDSYKSELTRKNESLITKEIVKIEEKEFSLETLFSIYTALYPVMETFCITEVNVLQRANCVEIYVKNIETVDLIYSFLKNKDIDSFNNNAIRVIETTDEITYKANAFSGVETYWSTLLEYSTGTIGFNATYVDNNGKTHYGVVTNAHVAALNSTMKLGSNGQSYGTTILSVYGTSVDLAFVEFSSSSWALTSRLVHSNGEQIYRVADASDWVEGRETRKYDASSGTNSGTLLALYTSATVGSRTYYGVFKVSNYVEPGDSGGPIGRQSTKEVFRILGITFAGPSNGAYTFGCSCANMASYGITPYTVQ